MALSRFFIFAVLVAIIIGCASNTPKDKPSTVTEQVVERFQSELISVMKDGKRLGYSGRYDKLSKAVINSHDLPKITQVIVGKEWAKLTSSQQKALVDSIVRLYISSYANNFKDYAGESFVIDSEEETTRGGVLVHSHLIIPSEDNIKFDYLLKGEGNDWRIINVIANEVSDLALKRDAYTKILQLEGFDELIAKINEKIDGYAGVTTVYPHKTIKNKDYTQPIVTAPLIPNAPPMPLSEKPLNLEEFKKQCKHLGFKEGTADFGNCVLQLNEAK